MSWRPQDPPARWLRRIPARYHKLARIALGMAIGGSFLAFFFCLYYVTLAASYDITQVGKLPQRNHVYDRFNNEIDAVVGSNIDLIQFEDLPPFMVKALQAREDAEFFTHSGVHLRGLARATVRNIKDRKFTQGASTLSMQLARNTYEIRAKSLHRKFLEIALTLRVEKHYTKQQIMAGYLNRIYFGVGAGHLGVQDAARHYFRKHVKDLNEAECAMLIGIIRGPHIFSPWRDWEAAQDQRDQVLQRMIAMNFIDEAEKQRIIALPIHITKPEQVITEKSYAIQAIIREVNKLVSPEEIQLGGLHIYTTLDMPWQRRLETELKQALNSLEKDRNYQSPTLADYDKTKNPNYLQMTAVTLETKTGAILAQIGGRNFEHSAFDRCHTARRDLGTAFEPFVAVAAAQRGRPVYPGSPVRTGKPIGPDGVQRIARRCGLSGPFADTEDLYRGAVSATPMEMSIGLATLANQGQRPKPFLIREIRNSEKEIIVRNQPELFHALTPAATREALKVLKQTKGSGNFTGATGSEREAWMLRLGPKGSTAIWVGFDQPQVITQEARLKQFLSDIVNRLDN
jgi:membrane peptidoglycan carboxypeptidase